MRDLSLGCVLAAGLALTAPAAVTAQTQSDSDPGATRSEAFRAVDAPVEEDIAGAPLMLIAYAVVWLVVFGYVWRLTRMQARTQRELERLEEAFREREGSP